jgi:hypothetical protein
MCVYRHTHRLTHIRTWLEQKRSIEERDGDAIQVSDLGHQVTCGDPERSSTCQENDTTGNVSEDMYGTLNKIRAMENRLTSTLSQFRVPNASSRSVTNSAVKADRLTSAGLGETPVRWSRAYDGAFWGSAIDEAEKRLRESVSVSTRDSE